MNHSKLREGAPRWFGCGALVILLSACSGERVPAQSATSVDHQAVDHQATVPVAPERVADETRVDPDPNSANVRISEEVLRQCQLPDVPAEAPQFDFDESRLRPRGRDILGDVARCLSQGPMKGRAITIIGHTDPRGADQYNRELALNRADAARNYLLEQGVTQDQIRLASRGEADAQGTSEASWALDRRIDIEIDRGAPAAARADGARGNNPFAEFQRIRASDPKPQDHDAMVYADQVESGVPTSTNGSANGSVRASGRYR